MSDKKTITRSEYLQLVGLRTLGRNHAKMVSEVETAINQLLGLPEDDMDVSDLMFGDNRTVEWLMENHGVTMEAPDGI